MEIKSKIRSCDVKLAVYAWQYLPSYTVYEIQCIYNSYYVQQNRWLMLAFNLQEIKFQLKEIQYS